MTELESVVATVLELPRADVNERSGPANTAAWTSLRHVQLIVRLQHVYGVEITARDARRLRTVGTIRTFLRSFGVEQ